VFSEVVSLLTDIGLGAVAIGIARSLKANVAANTALLSRVVKVQEDHEARLSKLEGAGEEAP
jgi:translation initiation factor 1 (eIF-1/SUI1)